MTARVPRRDPIRSTPRVLARAGLTALLLPGLALAQAGATSTSATSASATSADDSASTRIVITGSTRTLKQLDAPFAISVLDAESLRAAGPMVNLSEALALVPGLVANNRSNHAQDLQISSRGFGARASFGVRGLRLYADGLPATMPDGQGQVAHFDLAGAERVEVLRGPFSALYGNASGGVIAVFSAPVRERAVELSADNGSFGLRQQRIALAAPLAAGFDLRASLVVMASEGFRPQSAAQRQLGTVRLGWQHGNDSVVLRLSDHAQDADDPLGLNRAQFEADPRQVTPQAPQFDTRKTIRQTQAGLVWRHRFGEGVLRESSLSAYDGRRGVTQWLAIPQATQAPPRHGGGVVDFDRGYRGTEARLVWQLAQVDLVTGLNWETQQDDRQGYENFTTSATPPATTLLAVTGRLRRDEDNRATTREVFAQALWSASQTVAVTGGVRSGRIALRADDRYLSNGNDSGRLEFRYTNPVLGLRWLLQPGWTLHASAARGFESPTLGELAYRADNAAGFNTTLKGQTSRQLELGSKVRGQGFEADLVVFDATVDDELGVLANAGGRTSYRNVGRTQRRGIELAMRWRLAEGLTLQAAASRLQAVYRDGFLTCVGVPCTVPTVPVAAGNRIAGTQAAAAAAELAWKPAALPGEWAIEWRAIGRSPVNDINSDFAAGHALVHLRWRHALQLGPTDTLELLARIDNLADRHHAGSLIVNDGNQRFFEPGAPRSALLSLRWQHRW